MASKANHCNEAQKEIQHTKGHTKGYCNYTGPHHEALKSTTTFQHQLSFVNVIPSSHFHHKNIQQIKIHILRSSTYFTLNFGKNRKEKKWHSIQ